MKKLISKVGTVLVQDGACLSRSGQKTMRTKDLIGSLLWLLAGCYVAIHSYRMGLGRLHQPGPGFIFFLAALLLMILSIVAVAKAIWQKPDAETGKGAPQVWSGVRWKKILLVLGAAAAYVCIFNTLGFVTSTFLLMVLLFKGVEPTRWQIAILNSIVTTLFSYLIFKLWLGVPFPEGILGY